MDRIGKAQHLQVTGLFGLRRKFCGILLVEIVERLDGFVARAFAIAIERLEQDPEGLPPMGYYRRYVCQPLRDATSCFSLGVRDPFAGSDTPIWLRFHRIASCFPDIRDHLQSSDIAPKLVGSQQVDPNWDVPLLHSPEAGCRHSSQGEARRRGEVTMMSGKRETS